MGLRLTCYISFSKGLLLVFVLQLFHLYLCDPELKAVVSQVLRLLSLIPLHVFPGYKGFAENVLSVGTYSIPLYPLCHSHVTLVLVLIAKLKGERECVCLRKTWIVVLVVSVEIHC